MTAVEKSKGMNMLKSLDRVVIRETGGSSAKYVVVSADGAVLLHAKEDSGLLDQILAGQSRAFEIDVFDTDDKEVIKLRRPYTVGSDKMDVCVCGEAAAVVRKEVTLLKPVLVINDPADRTIIRVKGPVSISAECNFELYSPDKTRVGCIRRVWGNAGRERELFALHFPETLEVRYKAAVIGTCFLIVIKLRRPYTVGSDKMDVCVCGEAAAVVRKEVTLLKPVLVINDPADRTIIRVKGPVSISAECNFELYSPDKTRVGCIRRVWGNAGRERELFALHFPETLEVRYKAAVIGTCFLINAIYW